MHACRSTLEDPTGDEVAVRHAFVTVLVPTVGLNLLVGAPVYAACARLVGPADRPARTREVLPV